MSENLFSSLLSAGISRVRKRGREMSYYIIILTFSNMNPILVAIHVHVMTILRVVLALIHVHVHVFWRDLLMLLFLCLFVASLRRRWRREVPPRAKTSWNEWIQTAQAIRVSTHVHMYMYIQYLSLFFLYMYMYMQYNLSFFFLYMYIISSCLMISFLSCSFSCSLKKAVDNTSDAIQITRDSNIVVRCVCVHCRHACFVQWDLIVVFFVKHNFKM